MKHKKKKQRCFMEVSWFAISWWVCGETEIICSGSLLKGFRTWQIRTCSRLKIKVTAPRLIPVMWWSMGSLERDSDLKVSGVLIGKGHQRTGHPWWLHNLLQHLLLWDKSCAHSSLLSCRSPLCFPTILHRLTSTPTCSQCPNQLPGIYHTCPLAMAFCPFVPYQQ